MKIILVIVIILSLCFNITVYSEVNVENSKISTLENLIEEALKNNPELKVAYEEWQAAQYKITQEISLPDPTVRYTYFGESVETRVGPQEHKYGGSINIPFPSKLYLKGKAQSRQAEMLREKYEAVRREVIKEIKFEYYDLYWIDKAIEVTEQEKGVVERVEKVARRKYETNRARQQDVIKAQIELSNFVNRLLRLKQNRNTLVAKMNNTLSWPQGTGIKVESGIKLPEFNYKVEDLREMALDTKQELVAAKMDLEKAEYEKSLAVQDYLPDLTFSFDYIQVGKGHTNSPNDGQDAWMTTFSVNIPLWFDKQWSQVQEKRALLKARQRDVTNIENKILYEVEDLYYKILTYRDIVTLYKTALVPQAKQSMEATRKGYETATLNFIDWLDAERILLQTRIAYYKSIVDYMKSIAFLERIIGQDLYPIEPKGSKNDQK